MFLLLAAGGIAVPVPVNDLLPPTNLQLQSSGARYVNLVWAAGSRAGNSYAVYYKCYLNGVWDGNQIPFLPNDFVVTYYIDDLTANTSYTAYITLVDHQGLDSLPTNTVSFTTARNTETLRMRRTRGYYA